MPWHPPVYGFEDLGASGRVLSGEHPPGAATSKQIEDGVGDAPSGPRRRATAPLGGLEEGLQQGPLRVVEVGEVRTGTRHGDLQELGSDAP